MHSSMDTVAMALVFGALHALEPGHGKTALLAYMVDGKKSYWHSVVIGLSSLFSHTISILLISLIVHATAHMAGEFLDSERVTGYIGLCSGSILLLIGCYLILKTMKKNHHHDTCCDHNSHRKSESESPATKESRFSLSALLGVSVGLYPCPTAIASYLNAIADGNISSGYVAIFIYGCGIGLTITCVGVISGYFGKSAFSNLTKRISPVMMSRIQAVIFIVLGAGQLLSFSNN